MMNRCKTMDLFAEMYIAFAFFIKGIKAVTFQIMKPDQEVFSIARINKIV